MLCRAVFAARAAQLLLVLLLLLPAVCPSWCRVSGQSLALQGWGPLATLQSPLPSSPWHSCTAAPARVPQKGACGLKKASLAMRRMMNLLALQMVWKPCCNKFNFATQTATKILFMYIRKDGKNHILKRFPGKTSLCFASWGKEVKNSWALYCFKYLIFHPWQSQSKNISWAWCFVFFKWMCVIRILWEYFASFMHTGTLPQGFRIQLHVLNHFLCLKEVVQLPTYNGMMIFHLVPESGFCWALFFSYCFFFHLKE